MIAGAARTMPHTLRSLELTEVMRPEAPRMAARLIDDISNALDEQTVVVPPGTLDVVMPSPARSLAAVHEQRRALENQIKALLEDHPLPRVLTSMPGVAIRTASVLLVTVGDGTGFPTAALHDPAPPHQRALRHAPLRHLLRTTHSRSGRRTTNSGLTRDVEALHPAITSDVIDHAPLLRQRVTCQRDSDEGSGT